MTNSSDFDKWLADNGFLLETFTVYASSGSLTLMQSPTLATFKQYLTDYKTEYNPVMVYKRNSGVSLFTYNTISPKADGETFTVNDSAPAGPDEQMTNAAARLGSGNMGIWDGLYGAFEKQPIWAQNIETHAISGFLLGFSAVITVQLTTTSTLPFVITTLGAACIAGFYGAMKEVAALIESGLPGATTPPAPGAKARGYISRKLL